MQCWHRHSPNAPCRLVPRVESSVSMGDAGVFGRINSVVLDAVGQVYVADGLALEIRVFDTAGRSVRSFGRSGQGPGEFRELYSLAFMGDSLLALDARNARITVWSRAGAPIGTWPWLPLSGPSRFVRFYSTGPREAYVLGFRQQQRPRESVFLRLTANGPTDTVSYRAPEGLPTTMLAYPRRDGGISFFTIPFAGTRVALPAPGNQLASAWSTYYRITPTGSDGDTLRVVERAYSPLPVTDAQWIAATADFMRFQQDWPGAKCTPPAMERPSVQPALQGIYFDHDGGMVVEVTVRNATRYDFYNAEGQGASDSISGRT